MIQSPTLSHRSFMNTQAKQYWEHVSQKIQEYNTNGKPTIALFCDSFYPSFDGVINVSTNYAERLQDTYNVVMIAPRTKQHYIEKSYLTLLSKSLYWKMINYQFAFPQFDKTFKKYLKQLRIDLVHIHSPFPMGRYGIKYAKKHHIPVVATFHTQFKKDFLRYVKFDCLTKPLVKYIVHAFNQCDEVWTMNYANVEILQSYGYKGITRIMPNGTDLVYQPQHDQLINTINQTHQLEDKKNVLMFCGRIVENKNIFLIADALALLKEKNFDFHMLYVGNGLDLEKLKKYVTQIGIADHVTFTGKIMDRTMLGAYYLRSDLFVFPSTYDTDGLVKYEAAAFHTPSLLMEGSPSAVGTVDNQTAFHSIPDAHAIADKIIEVFSNPQVLEKVSEQAYQHLYKHWDSIVHDVSQAYEQLIGLKDNTDKQ